MEIKTSAKIKINVIYLIFWVVIFIKNIATKETSFIIQSLAIFMSIIYFIEEIIKNIDDKLNS